MPDFAILTEPMQQVLRALHKSNLPKLHQLTPQQAKQRYEKSSQILEIAKRQLARIEQHHFQASDGQQLEFRLYAPNQDTLPILIYFHGGGFVVGSINSHDQICREISYQANCAVLSLNYRLAPEHTFPTAHNDAWDMVQFISKQNISKLGLNHNKIILAGDSAGGNLATYCAMLAADNNINICGQVLLYPGVSNNQDSITYHQFSHGWLLEKEFVKWAFNLYAPDINTRNDWRFAPLLRDEIPAMQNVWLGLAECDPIYAEALEYGDLLRKNFINVDLHIYQGVVHEFIKMGKVLPQAKQAITDMARFIKQQFSL